MDEECSFERKRRTGVRRLTCCHCDDMVRDGRIKKFAFRLEIGRCRSCTGRKMSKNLLLLTALLGEATVQDQGLLVVNVGLQERETGNGPFATFPVLCHSEW